MDVLTKEQRRKNMQNIKAKDTKIEIIFQGGMVIRFWGEEIRKHTDECVRVVEETIFDQKIVK